MNYFEMVYPSLLRHTPELLAWLFGIVLAVLMLRRGGGKAEKLLLAGCSLMFVIQIALPFLSGLARLLASEQKMRLQTSVLTFQIPVPTLGIAGLVCLVYAFWVRFRARRQESA